MSLKFVWSSLINVKVLLLTTVLIIATSIVNAAPNNVGKIQAINLANQSITIDTNKLRINESTKIKNLAGPAKKLHALAVGQPVRYSINGEKLVTEIYIYPSDPKLQRKLGYNPAAYNQ